MGTESSNELLKEIIQTVREEKPQSVTHLVTLIQERSPFTEQQITAAVLELQNEGKLNLEDMPQPFHAKSIFYLKSNIALWYWATMALAAIATVVVLAIPEELYPWVYIRQAFGTLFVLLLPGYSLTEVLFPKQILAKASSESVEAIARVCLGIVLSLALVSLVGLVLNYTPWGVRLTPLVIGLLALTVFFATVGAVRKQRELA